MKKIKKRKKQKNSKQFNRQFKKKFLFTNLKNGCIVGKNKKCKKGLRYYERATATEKCWLVSSFV